MLAAIAVEDHQPQRAGLARHQRVALTAVKLLDDCTAGDIGRSRAWTDPGGNGDRAVVLQRAMMLNLEPARAIEIDASETATIPAERGSQAITGRVPVPACDIGCVLASRAVVELIAAAFVKGPGSLEPAPGRFRLDMLEADSYVKCLGSSVTGISAGSTATGATGTRRERMLMTATAPMTMLLIHAARIHLRVVIDDFLFHPRRQRSQL